MEEINQLENTAPFSTELNQAIKDLQSVASWSFPFDFQEDNGMNYHSSKHGISKKQFRGRNSGLCSNTTSPPVEPAKKYSKPFVKVDNSPRRSKKKSITSTRDGIISNVVSNKQDRIRTNEHSGNSDNVQANNHSDKTVETNILKSFYDYRTTPMSSPTVDAHSSTVVDCSNNGDHHLNETEDHPWQITNATPERGLKTEVRNQRLKEVNVNHVKDGQTRVAGVVTNSEPSTKLCDLKSKLNGSFSARKLESLQTRQVSKFSNKHPVRCDTDSQFTNRDIFVKREARTLTNRLPPTVPISRITSATLHSISQLKKRQDKWPTPEETFDNIMESLEKECRTPKILLDEPPMQINRITVSIGTPPILNNTENKPRNARKCHLVKSPNLDLSDEVRSNQLFCGSSDLNNVSLESLLSDERNGKPDMIRT